MVISNIEFNMTPHFTHEDNLMVPYTAAATPACTQINFTLLVRNFRRRNRKRSTKNTPSRNICIETVLDSFGFAPLMELLRMQAFNKFTT